ncbi:MAG: hypothetical protein ACOCYW_06570 [Roseicyclus sp.]
MTDTERTTLSSQIAALHARLDALDRHAQEREQRREARDKRLDTRLDAIAEDRRDVERRITQLEAVRPQAELTAREAQAAADALHEQAGRRQGQQELAQTWWARLGIVAGVAGSAGGLVGAAVAVLQAAAGG